MKIGIRNHLSTMEPSLSEHVEKCVNNVSKYNPSSTSVESITIFRTVMLSTDVAFSQGFAELLPDRRRTAENCTIHSQLFQSPQLEHDMINQNGIGPAAHSEVGHYRIRASLDCIQIILDRSNKRNDSTPIKYTD